MARPSSARCTPAHHRAPQVVFHLQQQAPPILPPLYQLFGDEPPAEGQGRRLRLDTLADVEQATATAKQRSAAFKQAAQLNTAPAEQLLVSFFERSSRILGCSLPPKEKKKKKKTKSKPEGTPGQQGGNG